MAISAQAMGADTQPLSLVQWLRANAWIGLALIVVGIDVTGALVALSGHPASVYAQFIYLPLILASVLFGVPGGMLCALVSGIVIGPVSAYFIQGASALSAGNSLDWTLHIGWLMVVAVWVAALNDMGNPAFAPFRAFGNAQGALTDISHARKHVRRAAKARASSPDHSEIVVAALQISNFEDLVNTFGYRRADTIIDAIATQIAAEIPKGALLSKANRNTLAIVGQETHTENDLSRWQRLGQLDERPIELDGVPVFVDTVMGLARTSRAQADLDQLLTNAESAARGARDQDESVGVYDPQDDAKRSEGLRLLGEFHRGLRNGEFQLEYQPKLALQERRFVGLEALARWHHPQRGFIGPGQFIPLIERTRAIDWFTRWALREAIQQIAVWRAQGYEPSVAVNLSTRNLLNTSLLQYIQKLLAEFEVPLSCLELEIAERALADVRGARLDLLRELHGAGVRVAVDNFGTGHASFAFLGRLPLDILKLDRSITEGLAGERRTESIVKRTVQMAHDLGIEVVGEGVESGAQLRALNALGCDYAQGFFIARPLAPTRVVGVLASDWREDLSGPTS